MRLKHLLTVLAILCSCMSIWASPVLPKFSDDNTDYWYYIVFSAGETVLGDQGARSPVITRIPDSSRENQLWKFIGNSESFIIVNKTGTYATFESKIRTTSDIGSASRFRLVPSSHPSMTDSWEIEYPERRRIQPLESMGKHWSGR